MAKCEWCSKNASELQSYSDAIGEVHHICSKCKISVDNYECRKCGATVDASLMINGLCMNCVQADMKVKSKKREEARMGVGADFASALSSDLEFTDNDYENWLTMGKAFSPKNMQDSKELRRIWIMVKLNAAGIYSNDVISKHFKDIESLLDRNFSKLVGNKCKILIVDSPETRKLVRQYETIDYENEVFILRA